MAIFVCTGSEANDQALRIARMHTGGEGIICSNLTYHGNTTAVDEISPLFYGRVSPLPNVRAIPFLDSYRPLNGLNGLEGHALADAYAKKITEPIESFEAAGIGFAGMIVCPIFANEGLPNVPAGFMQKALEIVHDGGGVFIADEYRRALAVAAACGAMRSRARRLSWRTRVQHSIMSPFDGWTTITSARVRGMWLLTRFPPAPASDFQDASAQKRNELLRSSPV